MAVLRSSPFSPVEERNSSQSCLCATFLFGSPTRIPRYIASGYASGDIRVHDTDALTASVTDGISATHLYSANYSNRTILGLKPLQTGTDTLLVFIDRLNLAFLSASAVVDKTLEEETKVEAMCMRQADLRPCTAKFSCFAVDDVHGRVFTGSTGGLWHCWDVETQKCIQQFEAHPAAVLDIDYSHGLLSAGISDGTACVWDVRSQSCICAFDPTTGKSLPLTLGQRSGHLSHYACRCARFDKTGRYLVAASSRKRVTAWNVRADAVQCSFDTEESAHSLDTAADSIYFAGRDGRIWRYSMYHAQMQRYDCSIAGISGVHIDKEQQRTLLVCGSGESIEMMTLDGVSLGRATGRTEPEPTLFSPIPDPPPFASPYVIVDSESHGSSVPDSPRYSPEIEEICDSGSEMITDDEDDVFDADQGSSGFEYSPVDHDVHFSTEEDEEICSMYDEDEPMGAIDLEEQLSAYGFARIPAYQFTSDSEVAPHDDLGMPSTQEYSNCEFSSSQEESGGSTDEEEE